MLMVVFGAGASYDSVPRLPTSTPYSGRPPLGDQLFENRTPFRAAMAAFPQCQALIYRLQNLPRDVTIEQRLEQFQNESSESPERKCQLAAIRFYLQHIIWTSQRNWGGETSTGTNYQNLLDHLEPLRRRSGEQVALVTFNYDTMLEDALTTTVNPTLTYGDLDHYATSNFPLFKLHGSVNWAREINTPSIGVGGSREERAKRVIDSASHLEVSRRYVITRHVPPEASGRGNALFPAIALPVEHKREFECPDDHLAILRECIPRVTHLLLIGWRATEQHFLEELSRIPSGPLVHTVTATDRGAEQIQQRLRSAGIGTQFSSTPGGFTEFVHAEYKGSFLQNLC